MYNRILVALDTLEPAVFKTALSIAAATDATLLVLHVLSDRDTKRPTSPIAIAWDYATPLGEQTWNNYQARWRDYVEDSLTTLRDYVGRAEAAGVVADFLQANNKPGQGICQAAQNWRSDLIIMGSHQRKGVEELVLGSVSNYVMHHAPCSVMIVALEAEKAEETAPSTVAELATSTAKVGTSDTLHKTSSFGRSRR